MKKTLSIILALLLPLSASAVYIVDQGGTGSTTLSGILKGNGKSMVQTAIGGTDYVLPSALSSYLTLSSWYATTTDGLDEGLTNLYFTPARAQSALAGLYEVPLTFSYPLVRTLNNIASAFSTSSSNTWGGTQAFTNTANFNGLTNNGGATTTNLAVTSVTNALHLGNATGGVVSYAGASCTNQFLRSLNGAGAGTCATVANTDLANSGITINGVSVSLGGTVTVASTTLLANNNTWSGTNVFGAATSSSLGVTNLSAGLVKSLAGGSLTNAVAGVDYQAPGSYINLSSLSASAPLVYNNGTGAFSWTGLATTSQPASSNVLVSNGGAGVYGVATGTVSATLPISVTAGRSVIGGALSVTIADAVADGSTKGAASFTTNDFNTTSGNVSIDYTNGTAAAAGVKGFLTGTDWSTFNSKENALTFTYPLSRSVNTVSLAFGTTTSNLWAGTQTFTNAPIFSSLTGLLKGNGAGALTVASLGTDYVNGSGTNGNCVAWGASNALTDAGAPCGSGSGGANTDKFATSSVFASTIYTNAAYGLGIGTSTPFGALTLASSSPVTTWMNYTSGSANNRLAYMTWNGSGFVIGTSTDTLSQKALLTLTNGTSTIDGLALTIGTGSYPSSLVSGVGTSTFWGGVNLSNGGCFAVAGTCMGSMALSGTIGQTQYYSGVNTAVGTSSLFIATSEHVGIGSTTPWAQLSVDTPNNFGDHPVFVVASSSLSMFYVGADGKIGINKTNPQHRLDVNGRIAGQPMFDCFNLFLSQSNVTADQLGSATVASFACEGNMFVDVNTSNAGILALTSANVEAPMASGTPALQLLDASIATAIANNLVFLKTHVVGSATSSLGQGIAMQATIMTPKVSTATTSVTYVPLGFSDAAITSLTTTAAYALPSNGCLLVASSTPNWKLQCTKAGVVSLQDTGFATSTTAFKALLTIDSTGANVYFNGSVTSSATIPAANLPVVWLRPTVGVGLTGGITPAQGRLGIGNLTVWGQDKY